MHGADHLLGTRPVDPVGVDPRGPARRGRAVAVPFPWLADEPGPVRLDVADTSTPERRRRNRALIRHGQMWRTTAPSRRSLDLDLAEIVPETGDGWASVAAQDRVDHLRDVLVDRDAVP